MTVTMRNNKELIASNDDTTQAALKVSTGAAILAPKETCNVFVDILHSLFILG